jgi:hypothetical protein
MSPTGRSSPPPRAPAAAGGGAEAAGRAAIFALPVFSVLIAALTFLGPGGLHAATGARVRGLPIEGGRALALRIEVVRSFHDVVDATDISGMEVEASAPGQTLSTWRGAAGPDGVADVLLSAHEPLRGAVAVAITAPRDGRTVVLAGGEIRLRPPAPAFVQLGAVRGAVHGDLSIRVDATRGVMASPFPERMRVVVASALGDAPVGPVEVQLSGAGLDIAPERLTTDDRGRGSFVVKALAHNVELVVAARAGDKTARWEGTLPVVPGALWLEPAPEAAVDPAGPDHVVSLVSAVPRERAYLSVWSEEGRIFGAVVPLARDGFGFFRGQVTARLPPAARLVYATVAGDPVEQGTGTVAWPIRPTEGAVAGARGVQLLLDGVPAAVEREKVRAWAARRAGLWVIGAAALAEVLLMIAQSRASQRKLDAHLIHASAAMPDADRVRLLRAAREHPLLHGLLAVSLVSLGFAMVAALSTFR